MFRIADHNQNFTHFPEATEVLEREFAKKVDIVFYTAKNLAAYVESINPRKAVYLPNGVDVDHFINGSREIPPEFRKIPKPIVIYVGSMNYWFDFSLVNRMAKKLPNVSFVLIGPDDHARNKIEPHHNVHLLGERSFDKIPSYLHNANVGMIPFDVNRHPNLINSVNPLKLYEYMASGLPVVCSRWRELESIASPAILTDTFDEFVKSIEKVINHPKSGKYVEFAKSHSWSLKFHDIISHYKSI